MIFIKSKFNNILNQEIPHNKNFACAMYGFLEMGAEIKFYNNIEEIYNKFSKEDTVVDYIDQVTYMLNKFNKKFISYTNYPIKLQEFYNRDIWKDTINHFNSDENLWTKGYFIKPLKEKAFTGRVVREIKDLIGCGSENYEIYVSEHLDIIQEWRGYIYYDNLLDLRPYVYYKNGEPDKNVINRILDKWRTIENRPDACSIDIGLTQDNKTVIIEVNDCISLGNYGLPTVDYAKMISARQSQILDRKDEFKF